MEAVFGGPTDLDAWMELVNRVSWNFPGLETAESLEEHRETVLRFMEKGQALCVRKKGEMMGVLLFSPKKEHDLLPGCGPRVQEAGRCFGSFGEGLVGAGQAERNYGLYLSGGRRKGKGSQGVVPEIWIQGGRTDGGVWISQPGVCSASIGLACGAGTAA